MAYKILLVEDHAMNRDMLSRRLEKLGYEVVTATDGRQGVATASRVQPDLILMDMSLPVMDGWEATRQVRANPQTAEIPILALTAHIHAYDRDKAMEAGCNEYETKPIDLQQLTEKMEMLLKDLPDNR
ncbi:MAG: response regulator [Pseudomonadales bacterium]